MRRRLAKPTGWGRNWATGGKSVDAFDVKADALAALAAAGAPAQALQINPGGPAWLHPGRSGTIQIGPQNVLGYFGELHPRGARGARRRRPACRVRGDPRPHSGGEGQGNAGEAAPRTAAVPAGRARFRLHRRSCREGGRHRAAAQGVDRKLITAITVFDVYEGQGIDPGKKSIAIAVTLQPREKTMTDQEIDAVAAKIVAEVGKRTGGVLRG